MTVKSGTELKSVLVKLSPRLWRRVKIQANIEQRHTRVVVQAALRRYLAEKGTPELADNIAPEDEEPEDE